MKSEYDAIVVGGGAAGLTSSAYLSRSGIRTLLAEKGEKTGGLVNTFQNQGFAFDGGIRAFENSGILLPMLKFLGIDMELLPNPVSIGIGENWTRLESRDSLHAYAAMLKETFPENGEDISRIADEIKKVIDYMDVIYGIDNPLFVENLKDPEYLRKILLPWLIKYQLKIRKAMRLNAPVYSYLKGFTSNSSLIDMIAQHFFKDTPTFFALSYFGLYLDYFYPAGGTGKLAEKLTESIIRSGGDIQKGTAAVKLDPMLRQIEFSNGQTVEYKKLIWAADQKTLYTIVKECSSSGFKKQQKKVEAAESSDSILTLFIGVDLDGDYFKECCGAHAFYTPYANGLSTLPSWKNAAMEGSDSLQAWLNSYLEKTTYEISCPALRDSTLAPEGQTGLIISTLLDYSLARHFFDSGEYKLFKKLCTDKIIGVLEASIFPGLHDKLLFSMCSTPLTIEKQSGSNQGAITGWAFGSADMPSENRFNKIMRSIITPIKDVFQCGQWTFSPAGLPISVVTGKLAADAVRKALK